MGSVSSVSEAVLALAIQKRLLNVFHVQLVFSYRKMNAKDVLKDVLFVQKGIALNAT